MITETNPFFTFLGHPVGAVTVADGRWTLQPNEKLPRLGMLHGRYFASESELTACIATCFSAKEQEAMPREDEARSAAVEQDRQESLRRAQERTYTGDRYDPTRSLKDIIRLLKADIADAVKTGELPPLRYDVRSYKGRDIHVVTEAACLSKVKASLDALQRRDNVTIGDPDSFDQHAFGFRVESPAPFTNREEQQLKKSYACGEVTSEEIHARLDAATQAQESARAHILREYGERWNEEEEQRQWNR